MQINENSLVRIFVELDDFCIEYERWSAQHPADRPHGWASCLSRSEAMTILVCYQLSGYKCFQYYYERLVLPSLGGYFPKLVGYKRFLRLVPGCLDHLYLFAQWQACRSDRTGIYYVDSKKLPVCDYARRASNRVFQGVAAYGKSSTGWFYGLKLHLVINNLGQAVSFLFTPANVADNNHGVLHALLDGLSGNCYGDKGYLSALFAEFHQKGLKLVTKTRRNMKAALLPLAEKYQLMKRGIIEAVNDILMTVQDLDHTRHRSPVNALAHMTAALVAYGYMEQKPSVHFPQQTPLLIAS